MHCLSFFALLWALQELEIKIFYEQYIWEKSQTVEMLPIFFNRNDKFSKKVFCKCIKKNSTTCLLKCHMLDW